MARVRANHENHPTAPNHFTLITYTLDAGPHFHREILRFRSTIPRPKTRGHNGAASREYGKRSNIRDGPQLLQAPEAFLGEPQGGISPGLSGSPDFPRIPAQILTSCPLDRGPGNTLESTLPWPRASSCYGQTRSDRRIHHEADRMADRAPHASPRARRWRDPFYISLHRLYISGLPSMSSVTTLAIALGASAGSSTTHSPSFPAIVKGSSTPRSVARRGRFFNR